MRIFRTAALVFALLSLPLSTAHAETAYDLLFKGLCLPLGSAGTSGCQIYWLNRISEGRGKTESHGICLDSCKFMYPVSMSAGYVNCKAACDNQRNNTDR